MSQITSPETYSISRPQDVIDIVNKNSAINTSIGVIFIALGVEFYSKREYARGACPMAGKTMIPLLAFAAWSGTGKTTLLKKLIPALCARGIRPGLIKHTHHDMDVDKPGKDSYELRKAGAAQTIVASQQRWALMTETPDEEELDLHFLASRMDTSKLDLILVEGFKHEEIAKIVLFRDGAGHRPEELVIDRHVIAVASDVPLNLDVALLDINDVEGLADFVVEWMQKQDG